MRRLGYLVLADINKFLSKARPDSDFAYVAYKSEMLSHEFLSADRKQQRTTFANGRITEFDMAANRFRVWGVPGFAGKWFAAPEIMAPEGSLTWAP